MAWSPEISQLSTDVTQLTNEVNAQKNLLSGAVTSAQSSRITANTGAAIAESSVVPSTTNMLAANTHKNSVLSIYGTQAAQQASVTNAAGQASAAAASAVTATAGLTQDLSGVAAQALHRSPNAITSMFIYDTSKDSDGGAWTEKCQHTSWYNETIYGKWLGPHINETYARYSNATLGAELITNGNFSNGSTGWTLSGFSIVDGVAVSNSSGIFIRQNVTTVPGKLYRVEYNAKLSASLVGSIVRLNSAGNLATTNVTGPTNTFGTVVEYVIAGSGTTGLEIITTAGSNIFSIDNVSLREVIAINTTSSDYFQLATDGKFYRLWKNLLKFSDQVENAAWSKRGVTITPNAVAGPFAGTFGDSIYVATNFATPRDIRQSVNMVAGVAYCYSAYIKAGTQNLIAIGSGNFNNFGGFVNLSTQVFSSVTPNTTTQIVSVGDGWYRVSISFVANTTVLSEISISMAGQDADADPTDFISVYGVQFEYSSTPTTYESKLAETSISEVFRGNKRDFPRLAGIVAEGANVNIYDLTEPGQPMWMRFTSGTEATINYLVRGAITAVNAIQGILFIGGTNTTQPVGGQSFINFAADDPYLFSNFTQKGYRAGGIANRNNDLALVYPSGVATGATTANRTYTISSIILPDAPTDQVTGLRVPTVLLATNANATVIRHNGTVVTVYGADCPYAEFTNDYRIRCKRGGTSAFYISSDWRTAAVPTSPLTLNGTSSLPNISLNSNNKGFYAKKQSFMYYSGAGEVAILQENPGTYAKGFVARVTNGFNTGWMPGDIRRTYLSDTETGSMAGTELITNGTFNTNTTGWTVQAGKNSTFTASAGVGQFTAGSTYGVFSQTFTTVIGKTYLISWSAVAGTGTPRLYVGNSDVNASLVGTVDLAGNFKAGFTATATTTFVNIGTRDAISGHTVSFDNISVREAALDRSYKAQSAPISGIITRSQLTSGTSLVGYSGFSTANYLQEPYSPDLDFGTGEFSASAWVNIPATLPDSSFPAISAELISGDPVLTVGATFSASALTIPGTVGSTGTWTISGHTAGKVYRLTFNVLELQSVGNPISIRVGVAGNAGLYGVTYNPSLGTKTIYFVATSGNPPTVSFQRNDAATAGQTRIGNVSVVEVGPAIIFDRSMSSGTRIRYGIIGTGVLTAEAFDGTTTRTVTTTATYNTGQWLKAEANYTTDGSLAIRVNGREVAVTRGTPLRSLNSKYNLLTYTEQFDNAIWNKGRLSVTPNVMTDPDGILSADAVFETAVSGIHEITPNQGVTTVSGSPYTMSIYVKANGRSRFRIQFSLGKFPSNQAFFDLSNNTVDNVIGGTASITPLSNGWYRCVFTVTASVTSFDYYPVYLAFVDSALNTGYLGDVTKGLYLWGAQFEYGTAATTYQRVSATAETNVAPLTIGNSYALDAPFPGSIALLKLGATVPTPEQSTFIYEQEKQLFRPGALSVLPDASTIIDMSYDDATDRWAAVSTTNESYWNGLVRSSVTAVPAGSYSKIATTSGVELVATTTTNPGVYVSIPPYALREELVKRSEAAGKLVRKTVTYDYTGGFTGNITTGSTSILSVAGLVYPTSYIGARISGTGIPANTVITGVSGTTIYISAPATATTTTLAITFLDFILPVGMEAKVVLTAGVIKREGSTSDYTRLFDGFIETIRFAVAPGSTAWVQIQATRTAQ